MLYPIPYWREWKSEGLLHRASFHNRLEMVKYFVEEKGLPIHERFYLQAKNCFYAKDAFFYAGVEPENLERCENLIEYFLSKGASLNRSLGVDESASNQTLLNEAIKQHNYGFVLYIAKNKDLSLLCIRVCIL